MLSAPPHFTCSSTLWLSTLILSFYSHSLPQPRSLTLVCPRLTFLLPQHYQQWKEGDESGGTERERESWAGGVRESLGEEWREKRLIYRRREEGRRGTKAGREAGTDGWMEQKVCERGRGEETRVKVVIDGRPGLRPLPHIGQGACFCQSSFHPFLSSSFSPFLPLSVIPLFVLCLFHFIYSLSFSAPLSPSFWHPPPSFQLLNHKHDHMKTALLKRMLGSHRHILLTIRTTLDNMFLMQPWIWY